MGNSLHKRNNEFVHVHCEVEKHNNPTKEKETGTWLFKFKHLKCGLHFVICTWNKDFWMGVDVTCPECGGKNDFLRWVEKTDQQIFQVVPGNAQLEL